MKSITQLIILLPVGMTFVNLGHTGRKIFLTTLGDFLLISNIADAPVNALFSSVMRK